MRFLWRQTNILENLESTISGKLLKEDGTLAIATMDMESITSGKELDGIIYHIDSIDCSGEGSGAVMHHNIEPALKDSRGTLIAVCIWEGGDSINKLTVKDGHVKWEAIYL